MYQEERRVKLSSIALSRPYQSITTSEKPQRLNRLTANDPHVTRSRSLPDPTAADFSQDLLDSSVSQLSSDSPILSQSNDEKINDLERESPLIQLSSLQENSLEIGFERTHAQIGMKCEDCGYGPNLRLIDLPCHRKLCASCILRSSRFREVEVEDSIYDEVFEFACTKCHKVHKLDPEIGLLLEHELGEPPP